MNLASQVAKFNQAAHLDRLHKVGIESVAKLRNTGSNLVEVDFLLAPATFNDVHDDSLWFERKSEIKSEYNKI